MPFIISTTKTPLSSTLTSIDLIKTLAIFLMLLDHVGFYLWPDNLWLRALGRWCVPIWFFLIGYGRQGRALEPALLWGSAILVLANGVVGLALLPLNILASMALARAVVPWLMMWLNRHQDLFWATIALLALIAPLTNLVIEYGSLGWILAMVGWQVRTQRLSSSPILILPPYFGLVAVGVFITLQQTIYNFSWPQLALASVGVIGALSYLCYYLHTPTEHKWLGALRTSWVTPFYQWCGRHSWHIYIGHLLLLKFLALALGQAGFGWFDLRL